MDGGEFEKARIARDNRANPTAKIDPGGSAAFLGQVTSVAPNIAVGKYLILQRTKVLGTPTERGEATFTLGNKEEPAYLLGPGLPLTGDYLVAKNEGNRWVVERTNVGHGGGGAGIIPTCFCSPIPESLSMTSTDESCNYRMFQSCSINYTDTPAWAQSLNLPAMAYLSESGFPDPVAGGALFYYYLTCLYNQFRLTRIYQTSPYGSPYQDGILYTWLIGGYGNTCNPFHLDNGTAFPGSDLSCHVNIDE